MGQSFFKSTRSFLGKLYDPISHELFSILRPEIGCPDPQAALKFIMDHKQSSIDFYLKRFFFGYELSLFKLILLSRDIALITAMFEHFSIKTTRSHDWEAVYESFQNHIDAIHKLDVEILKLLLNFFKPRLPSIRGQGHPVVVEDKTPIENFRHYFADFPTEEIWRLFIDGYKQKQETGWLDYEIREPGCMLAMLRGMIHVIENIEEPLDIPMLCKLHALCSTNVSGLLESNKAGIFRNNTISEVGLFYGSNCSIVGFIEMVEQKGNDYEIKNLPSLCGSAGIRTLKKTDKEIYSRLEKIINAYHLEINTGNNISKLLAIVKLIKELERFHPFPDANCRTICILLLFRELVRNGFSPVILDNPNCFEGFSDIELVNEIIEGMKTFQLVKINTTHDLGLQTNEMKTQISKDSKYNHLNGTLTEIKEYEEKIQALIGYKVKVCSIM